MANKSLQSIKFPGLSDTYIVPQIDDTLSVEGRAAGAKAAGDKINDLKSVTNNVEKALSEIIQYSSKYPLKEGYAIRYASMYQGAMYQAESFACTDYIDISGCSGIVYTAIVTPSASEPTHGTAFYDSEKVYISGVKSRFGGTERAILLLEVTVPEGAKYARFTFWNEEIRETIGVFALYDAEYYHNNIKADVDGLNTRTNQLAELVNFKNPTLPYTITATGTAINRTNGAQMSASDFKATDYVDIHGHKSITYSRIKFTVSTAPAQGMAFYDENKGFVSGIATLSGQNERGYEEYTIDVPANAHYARFTLFLDDTYGEFSVKGDNALKSNIKQMILESGTDAENSAKWLAGLVGILQKNNGKSNVATRMRMLCDTEWTPIAPVPMQKRLSDNSLVYGSFNAGEKQTGIPYGAQLTYEQWIGKCISFETFLSALKNPNSCIYDFSRVGTAYRQSAWYSVNCSKAVGWALNLANTYATGAFSSDPDINIIALAGNIVPSAINVGDILENPGTHTAIVTDLVYNTMGELSQIEVSEAVTPTCRRKRWNIYGTFESFFSKFSGYNLLRYAHVDDVPPINMEAMYPYISTSLGLNYGNKSNYGIQEDVKITLLNKISDTLIIEKDAEQIDAIDISEYDESEIYTYTPQAAGWYEVMLDGDAEDNAVGFCVNDNTATYDAGTNKLVFSSTESTLNMVSFSATTSRSHIKDQFPTAEDINNGYMILNVPSRTDYIHVIFANDYGKTIIEIAIN